MTRDVMSPLVPYACVPSLHNAVNWHGMKNVQSYRRLNAVAIVLARMHRPHVAHRIPQRVVRTVCVRRVSVNNRLTVVMWRGMENACPWLRQESARPSVPVTPDGNFWGEC